MTGTFGEVLGPRNQTGLEPRPARKKVPKIAITLNTLQIGSSRVPNCSPHSPGHFDIPIHGSTMKIVDARAIIVGAVDPRDARL